MVPRIHRRLPEHATLLFPELLPLPLMVARTTGRAHTDPTSACTATAQSGSTTGHSTASAHRSAGLWIRTCRASAEHLHVSPTSPSPFRIPFRDTPQGCQRKQVSTQDHLASLG